MSGSVEIINGYKATKLPNGGYAVAAQNGNSVLLTEEQYNAFRNKQLTEDKFQSNVNFKGSDDEPSRKKLSFFQTAEGKVVTVLGLGILGVVFHKQIGKLAEDLGIIKKAAKPSGEATKAAEQTANDVAGARPSFIMSSGNNPPPPPPTERILSKLEIDNIYDNLFENVEFVGPENKKLIQELLKNADRDDLAIYLNMLKGTPKGAEIEHKVFNNLSKRSRLVTRMNELAIPSNFPAELRNTSTGRAFVKATHATNGIDHEAAIIFDQNGKALVNIPSKGRFSFANEQSEAQLREYFTNGTTTSMFHHNPYETTFSADMLESFVPGEGVSSCKTIMSKTPDGYALLQRTTNPIVTSQESRYADNFMSFDKLAELKLIRSGKSDSEVLSELTKFRNEQYTNFANKFGHKYEYIPGTSPADITIPEYQEIRSYTDIQLRDYILKQGLCNPDKLNSPADLNEFLTYADSISLKGYGALIEHPDLDIMNDFSYLDKLSIEANGKIYTMRPKEENVFSFATSDNKLLFDLKATPEAMKNDQGIVKIYNDVGNQIAEIENLGMPTEKISILEGAVPNREEAYNRVPGLKDKVDEIEKILKKQPNEAEAVAETVVTGHESTIDPALAEKIRLFKENATADDKLALDYLTYISYHPQNETLEYLLRGDPTKGGITPLEERYSGKLMNYIIDNSSSNDKIQFPNGRFPNDKEYVNTLSKILEDPAQTQQLNDVGLALSKKYDDVSNAIRNSIADLPEGLRVNEYNDFTIDKDAKLSDKIKSFVSRDLMKKTYYSTIEKPTAGSNYCLENPLTSQKARQEIIDTHLGWDLLQRNWRDPDSAKKDLSLLGFLKNKAEYKFSLEETSLIEKAENAIFLTGPNSEVSSYELSKLGKMFRERFGISVD